MSEERPRGRIVLGLKSLGHDPGAALIADGKVVAISEERLNRIKYSPHRFPALSIDYCLKALNVQPREVDLVVCDFVGTDDLGDEEPASNVRRELGTAFASVRIESANHHDAHAATAYLCSPFDEAATLVYDGSGAVFKTKGGKTATETESFYRGKGNSLTLVDKTLHERLGPGKYPQTFGICKLYATFSMGYLSFGRLNEGKMMGLASYGDDSFLKSFPYERFVTKRDGKLVCNSQIIIKRPLLERIFGLLRSPRRILVAAATRISRDRGAEKPSEKMFEPVIMPRPARDPKRNTLPDEFYSSVAYAAQRIFERFAVEIGKKLRAQVASPNLCVAGGGALNIDANHNFLTQVGFKNLFAQPASSDAGIPLGCALWGYHVIFKQARFWIMINASLGRPYEEQEVRDAIEKKKEEMEVSRSADVAKDAAKLIADGKIVGWFQGGSEYGPRALGNRSILCDARRADMKDILNNRVKHRESWRPFATSILAERLEDWFDLKPNVATAFMLLAAPVRKEKRSLVPSIVHVDGTCRMQTLTPEANGIYYSLVREFEKLTGVPLVLNTSFNLAGEPIVETPGDALDTFLRTDMDYLVLGNYIIKKR